MTASKIEAISQCLAEEDVDLWKIRELALSEEGLVDDALRRRAWPLLVGIDHSDESIVQNEETQFEHNGSGIPSEAEVDQVLRDVGRCSWHLLTGSQRAKRRTITRCNKRMAVEALLRAKQARLGHLINIVLRDAGGTLRYYQGFHDIACIFLSTLGSDSTSEDGKSSKTLGLASSVLLKVANTHLSDAMKENFSSLIAAMKLVLFPLIAFFDPEIHIYLLESGVEPFFAISWVITWFSHEIRDTVLVKRIFDAVIAAHPMFPLYLSVAMVLHPVNRSEVLFADCEFSTVHSTLSSLPRNSYTPAEADETDDDKDDDVTEEGSMAPSTVSTVNSPVPFQELIDAAISYMRIIPPRQILKLARRYCNGVLDPFVQNSFSVSLLQTTSLEFTTPSDSLLMKQFRARKGLPASTRGIRRNNEVPSSSDMKQSTYLEMDTTVALIAAGFGPGSENKARKKLLRVAIAVAVTSMVIPLVRTYTTSSRANSKGFDNVTAVVNRPKSDIFDCLKFENESCDNTTVKPLDSLDVTGTKGVAESKKDINIKSFASSFLKDVISKEKGEICKNSDEFETTNEFSVSKKEMRLAAHDQEKKKNRKNNSRSRPSDTSVDEKVGENKKDKKDKDDVKEDSKKPRWLHQTFQHVQTLLKDDAADVVFL